MKTLVPIKKMLEVVFTLNFSLRWIRFIISNHISVTGGLAQHKRFQPLLYFLYFSPCWVKYKSLHKEKLLWALYVR